MKNGAYVSKSDDILCLPRSRRDCKYQDSRSARAGRERSTQTAMGTMAQCCVMRELIARERFVSLGMRDRRAECRGVADPGSSRDAAAFYRSLAQERTLPPGRSRYNNCFIVHSLSLTRALYVSTVSDRFA